MDLWAKGNKQFKTYINRFRLRGRKFAPYLEGFSMHFNENIRETVQRQIRN